MTLLAIELGRVFDEVPELYDRVRPRYPAEMFADLVTVTGMYERSSVLEVGCGTGQATRSLAALGCSVTAIGPGADMAALARQRIAMFRLDVDPLVTTVAADDGRASGARRLDVAVLAGELGRLRPSDIGRSLRGAKDEGLPLVWVPRAELVKELLAPADAAARRDLLEKHVDDIVSDCAEVADREYHPELVEYADRMRDVVDAHRAGLHAPGQALAAVVVTALLQWVYGHGELRRVKTSPMRAKDEDEQVLRDLKVAVRMEAAVPAVQGGMDELSDDKLPDGFNRHSTPHRVLARAYTGPNAMSALMLATGLLAEAQQLLEDGRLTA